MGLQGRLVHSEKLVYFYRKPVLPQSNGATSEAIAIVYRGTYGTVSTISISTFYLSILHSFMHIAQFSFPKYQRLWAEMIAIHFHF